MIPGRKIGVLIIDASASARQALREILDGDPEIEVIATAADPWAAAERMRKAVPDVITLDLEVPRMDGLSFLGKLMRQHPLPVVICSSLAPDSDSARAALDRGAVEFVEKPRDGTPREWKESLRHICDAVRAAARRRPPLHAAAPGVRPPLDRPDRPDRPIVAPGSRPPGAPAGVHDAAVQPTLTTVIRLPPAALCTRPADGSDTLIAIGASTGGTEALLAILRALPADTPGIVVVQHMPEQFTRQFAARLDTLCAISVKEARSGDPVQRGQALIAPGNHHLLVKRTGARYHVEISDGPQVNRHRPSVDVLFRSTARYAGAHAIGVILTGMGNDGARGMLEMKRFGAHTIAQDEASSVVFGMPGEAIKRGAADRVLPLDQIAGEIVASGR